MAQTLDPIIIEGASYTDKRGALIYNNTFDAGQVRRIYFVENASLEVIRAWQGHKIEQRWFTAVKGSFLIKLIKIDNWVAPSTDLKQYSFTLTSEDFKVLFMPSGYASSIRAIEEDSKLMVMGDYMLGATKDEYRFAPDYFIEN